MNQRDLKELCDGLIEFGKVVNDRFNALEERIKALEAQQPEPLTFPPIDLGFVEGCK